ncbi:MAG: DUF1571 domain-containing protein [Gemmataceae bacterium]|nr:DUF1571 domain-containing protein [Gemmataceae bacterium]
MKVRLSHLGSCLVFCLAGCFHADSIAPTKLLTDARQRAPQPAPTLCIPGQASILPPHLSRQGEGSTRPDVVTLPLTLISAQDVDAAQTLPALGAGSHQLDPKTALRDLYEKAARKYVDMDSYILRLRRREVINGTAMPEELILFKFRRELWSVYFKWLGPEAKGREVIFVKGRYENLIHTLTAANDIFLLPAGRRIKMSPDSILVKSKSRYPITEAGMGALVDRFGRLVTGIEKGDPREGKGKYLGPMKRPEFEHKLEAVQQTLPPKADPVLPGGGNRLWFFDPQLLLPVLVVTRDETGREVEYYCHDRFQFPVRLDDDDFNPDLLWKNAK